MKSAAKIKPIKIFASDPGTMHYGWCMGEYDIAKNHATILRFGEINGEHIYRRLRKEMADMSRRFTILEGMYYVLEELVLSFGPDYMVSEDTFWNPGRPNAFQALSLVINMQERLSWNLLRKPLYTFPPQQVKRVVTDLGSSSKTTVRECLFERPNLTIKDTRQSPIDKLNEHSADAIAAFATFIEKTIPTLLSDIEFKKTEAERTALVQSNGSPLKAKSTSKVYDCKLIKSASDLLAA